MNDRVQMAVKSFEDLVSSIGSFTSFRVADRLYSSALLIAQLTIDASDLVTEASTAAAWQVYWGREAARARRYKAQCDRAYRRWRDGAWLRLKQTPLEPDGKCPTDSQCDKLVHCEPQYGEWAARLDDAQESAECAEAVLEAFRTKSEQIRNAQKILHDEAGGPYQIGIESRQSVERQTQYS
jgi:hypothetical protein